MSDDDDGLTPGQRLQQIIKARGLNKAKMARDIFGEKAPWLRIHRLTKDRGFNEENQELLANYLGVPKSHFSRPDLTARKEAWRREALKDFKLTELGRKASAEELRILESIQFVDDILPLEMFYTLTLLATQNRLTPEQYQAVLADNRALLESALKKRPPPEK